MNDQLRVNRKALRKEKKKLERSEERFFISTYDMMVRRVAEVGLDQKLILMKGLEDPLVVSSNPDEDLSD